MHDALKKVLQEALPRMVGGSVMVSDEALENGGDERFMAELRRKLALLLADFIVGSKVLDGADESCFRMVPHDKLAATECTASLHVLTPKELEALVKSAFEAGVQVGRKAESYGPKPGDYVKVRKPWEYGGDNPPPWAQEFKPYDPPPSRMSADELKRLMEMQWAKAFEDEPTPGGASKKGKRR